MKELVRNEHTMIVINGKPYGLYREEYFTTNNVCAMCDLSHICQRAEGGLNLRELCRGDDNSNAWYFVEDWQHLTERILDFIDLADEHYTNR